MPRLFIAVTTAVVLVLVASGWARAEDVNAKDRDGRTPLHRAAADNAKEVAELLIAKGTRVNAKDKDGQTPLALAEANKHEDLAALLRSHGAIK